MAGAALALTLVLPACAIHTPDATPDRNVSVAWQAPLPHGGETEQVARWWQRLEDPVLAALVDTAQQGAPGLMAAMARIDQSRATAMEAGALRSPTLDGRSQLSRSYSLLPPSMAYSMGSMLLDASWELDLFGRLRRMREAAIERHSARVADWHDARVSLAADVATVYVNIRLAESLLGLFEQSRQSQGRSVSLTTRKVRAGFSPPSDEWLSVAREAESIERVRAQRAQVDLLFKSLVVLTGLSEPELRERMAPGTGKLPQPGALSVAAVPAQALAQRADLAAIEREMAAASREVGVAKADRYPRIALSGSIGLMHLRAAGQHQNGRSWSIGSLLGLPLLDGGRRAAVVDRADARFTELSHNYRARALQAVREVEEALVRLDSATDRIGEAERAADSFFRYLKATRARYENGSGTLFEQEDARRSTLTAFAMVEQIRAERLVSWVGLYKALGGGWQVEDETPQSPPSGASRRSLPLQGLRGGRAPDAPAQRANRAKVQPQPLQQPSLQQQPLQQQPLQPQSDSPGSDAARRAQ